MKIGQCIVTIAEHGLKRQYSGSGIYSFSHSVEDRVEQLKKSYSGYPSLKTAAGLPVEDYPELFKIKKEEDGKIAITNTIFVGKNHDGSTGRGGNYLSHVLLVEGIDKYPMEFYGSQTFRRSMTAEEVSVNSVIDYLPELSEVCPSSVISYEKVKQFLNEKNRVDILCSLLEAVFHRDSTNKIIINDTEENLALWLAAIEMSLPLQCALDISCNLFEVKPATSVGFDVRGSVEGISEFDYDGIQKMGQHYAFDMIRKKIPDTYRFGAVGKKFNLERNFYKAVKLSWSITDGIHEFHSFLESYTYKKADSQLKDAYDLFYLMNNGFDRVGNAEKQGALKFEKKYGNVNTKRKLLERTVEHLSVWFEENNRYKHHIGIMIDKERARESAEKRQILQETLGLFLEYCQGQGVSADRKLETKLVTELLIMALRDREFVGDTFKIFYEKLFQIVDQYHFPLGPYFLSEELLWDHTNTDVKSCFSGMLENFMDYDKFKCLLRILKYQSAARKNLKGYQEDARHLVDSVLRNKWDRTAFQELLEAVKENKDCHIEMMCILVNKNVGDQAFTNLLWEFCEERYQASAGQHSQLLRQLKQQNCYTIMSYYIAVILMHHTELNLEKETVEYFEKYFKDTYESWDTFTPVIRKARELIKNTYHKKNQYNAFLYLFNGLAGKTDCQLKSEEFLQLISEIAQRTDIIDKKKIFSLDNDKMTKEMFEYISEYLKSGISCSEMDRLRLLNFLYRSISVSKVAEWRELGGYTFEFLNYPIKFASVDEKEMKKYFGILKDVVESTKILPVGYRVLFYGLKIPEKFSDLKLFIKKCVFSEIKSLKNGGDVRYLLGLIEEINKGERSDYKSILNEILRCLNDITIEIIRHAIQDNVHLKTEQKDTWLSYWDSFSVETEKKYINPLSKFRK